MRNSTENSLDANADPKVVRDFGLEWSRFNQAALGDSELERIFDRYFAVVSWDRLPPDAVAADIGCGSGRWARLVAPRVGRLHVVDASPAALAVARENLTDFENVEFHVGSVGELPIPDKSVDFAYSLGVLHHVPDTARAVRDVARKVRPGGVLLLYLYYAFDNRPAWFRALWRLSDLLRKAIAGAPTGVKHGVCDVAAASVYWPLARTAKVLSKLGALPRNFPLAFYRDQPFYVMRTDALDRFGTRLEQRFTKNEIRNMLESAGMIDIRFSEREPFWCAAAIRDQRSECSQAPESPAVASR